MRNLIIAAAVIVATAAYAQPPKIRDIVITKDVVACSIVDNDEKARELTPIALQNQRQGKPLPKGCSVLKRGQRFFVDMNVDYGSLVELMSECRGCLPSTISHFAPSHKIVGSYLMIVR